MLITAIVARLLSCSVSLGVPIWVLIWTNTFNRLDPIAAGILVAPLPEADLGEWLGRDLF